DRLHSACQCLIYCPVLLRSFSVVSLTEHDGVSILARFRGAIHDGLRPVSRFGAPVANFSSRPRKAFTTWACCSKTGRSLTWVARNASGHRRHAPLSRSRRLLRPVQGHNELSRSLYDSAFWTVVAAHSVFRLSFSRRTACTSW